MIPDLLLLSLSVFSRLTRAVTGLHSFLQLSKTPSYGWTPSGLSIHRRMDLSTGSAFGLLATGWRGTFIYSKYVLNKRRNLIM